MEKIRVVLSGLLVIAVVAAIIVLHADSQKISAQLGAINHQPQGQTVVYIKDGQGSQGVPYYTSVPDSGTVTVGGALLPNFTRVDMICWADNAADQRSFYVRVASGARVESNRVVVVRAEDTHNQTRVDAC